MNMVKTKEEIEILAEGGKRLAEILHEVLKSVQPGVSTKELDGIAENLIVSSGGAPSFKRYRIGSAPPYPATLCTSINDAIVHGLPREKDMLKDGDIIGIDIGMKWQGLYTDMAVTVPVGEVDAESQRLLNVTKKALEIGIEVVKPGGHIGDIGEAVQAFVEGHGFGVVRQLVGHGVGYKVHEDPQVPNYGKGGTGPEIWEGMVLALEPMVTAGDYNLILADDSWTWRTRDGSRAAHFEHTIVVEKHGARVLTGTV